MFILNICKRLSTAGLTCNCGSRTGEWLQDSREIRDTDRLPITRLHIGAEDAYVHIGPLRVQTGMIYRYLYVYVLSD